MKLTSSFKKNLYSIYNYGYFKKRTILVFIDFTLNLLSINLSVFLVLIFLKKNFDLFFSIEFISYQIVSSFLYIAFLYIFSFYKIVIRYIEFEYIFKFTILVFIHFVINIFLRNYYIIENFYLIIIFIQLFFNLYFFIYSRLSILFLYNRYFINNHNLNKAIIFGVNESALNAYSELSNYKIVAFLDENNKNIGRKIKGIKVIDISSAYKIIKSENVKFVFVAISNLSVSKRSKISELFNDYDCEIKFLPTIRDFTSGKIEISNVKSLKPSDILKRKIHLDFEILKSQFNNKIICITGSGGSIGSEIASQIIKFNPPMILLIDHSENNLFNILNLIDKIKYENSYIKTKVISLLGSIDDDYIRNKILHSKVQIIFHSAAYKHVGLLETNIISGIRNNSIRTIEFVDFCYNKLSNCERFVFISTDKAVNPKSVMGFTKRLAEIYIQGISTVSKINFSIVRFGNVLGSSGSVFELFVNQIKSGGPVTITHPEVTRYFMTISDAVGLVLQASKLSNDSETFVLNMGKPVKIINLARDMIRLAGLSIKSENNPEGDIAIKYIGLKKGEKTYEEILNKDDIHLSNNPDIYILKKKTYSFEEVLNYKNKIIEVVKNNDSDKFNSIIKELNL